MHGFTKRIEEPLLKSLFFGRDTQYVLEDADVSLVLTTSDMQSHMEPIAKTAGVRMHIMGAGNPLHGKASLVCLEDSLFLPAASAVHIFWSSRLLGLPDPGVQAAADIRKGGWSADCVHQWDHRSAKRCALDITWTSHCRSLSTRS